jgi:hypothetical protein
VELAGEPAEVRKSRQKAEHRNAVLTLGMEGDDLCLGAADLAGDALEVCAIVLDGDHVRSERVVFPREVTLQEDACDFASVDVGVGEDDTSDVLGEHDIRHTGEARKLCNEALDS